MKATVMESKNGSAVILTEDGMFRTVKGNYQVGWEFDYKMPVARNRKMTSRIAAVAACLLMAVSMGAYSYQNLMVYATVTLNGTAPIQLELNRQDKVIGVKAIDETGEALAAQLLDSGIKGEYFQDAVAKAEQMMKAQDKDNGPIMPKVQCKSSDKLKALADALKPEAPTAQTPEKPSTTEQSTTTSTSAASTEPEKQEVSAQESDPSEEEPTSTEASSATEPSSSEEMTPQDDPTEMSSQEDPTEMSAQEAPEASSDSQAAPAEDSAPAADKAPAEDADDDAPEEE